MAGDQPELHLELNDGRFVLIQWDIGFSCRNLFVAPDETTDFRDATAEETGLHPDELAGLVDEVYRAVQQDESERMAGEWDGADTWEEHGGER